MSATSWTARTAPQTVPSLAVSASGELLNTGTPISALFFQAQGFSVNVLKHVFFIMALFSSHQNSKTLQDSSSHRIF